MNIVDVYRGEVEEEEEESEFEESDDISPFSRRDRI